MANALFDFLGGLSESIEKGVEKIEGEVDGAIQSMDAGVDLDEILEAIRNAGADEDRLLDGHRKLQNLAQQQAPSVLRGWVIDGRVMPIVCSALCRISTSNQVAGTLARTLNGLGRALDTTESTPEELSGFADQLVRHTENGKGMLKLLQVDNDARAQLEGLILLNRVYPYAKGVLGKNLLSDPASTLALMQILQSSGGACWAAEVGAGGTEPDAAVLGSLCDECVRFLESVTKQEGDVRMLITAQDGAEALLAIVVQAVGTLKSAAPSQRHLQTAKSACTCVMHLAGHGAVAQNHMREFGHLSNIVQTLRCVVAAAPSQAPLSDALNEVVTTLLDVIAVFVGDSTSKSANAGVLLQSTSLVDISCQEAMFSPNVPMQTKVRFVEVLAGVSKVAEEAKLAHVIKPASGTYVLNNIVYVLLAPETPMPLRLGLDALLEGLIGRTDAIQDAIASELECTCSPAPAADQTPSAEPQATTRPTEVSKRILVVLAPSSAGPSSSVAVWFACRLLGHCLWKDTGFRARLAQAPKAGGQSVMFACLASFPTYAQMWRGGDRAVEYQICAVQQLATAWSTACNDAVQQFAASPLFLPELFGLLEQAAADEAVHVRGLAVLLIGVCLLGLHDSGAPPPVDAACLMRLIASRIGVDAFMRTAESFQRALAPFASGAGAAKNPDAPTRYDAKFVEHVDAIFTQLRTTMISLWLGGAAPPGASAGVSGKAEAHNQSSGQSSGGHGVSEDVTEQFKDLIKMQDKELRGLRAEVEKLRGENEQLRAMTTDEDKTLLVWKVNALTKQCESLQEQSDKVSAARSNEAATRLRERQAHRAQRQRLELQLQALAVALDEMELRALASEEAAKQMRGGTSNCVPAEATDDTPASKDTVEKDELLQALQQIYREVPEVRQYLAPLSYFAPQPEDPAEREAGEPAAAESAVGAPEAAGGRSILVPEVSEAQPSNVSASAAHQGEAAPQLPVEHSHTLATAERTRPEATFELAPVGHELPHPAQQQQL